MMHHLVVTHGFILSLLQEAQHKTCRTVVPDFATKNTHESQSIRFTVYDICYFYSRVFEGLSVSAKR